MNDSSHTAEPLFWTDKETQRRELMERLDAQVSADVLTRLRYEFSSQTDRGGEEDSDERAQLASDALDEIARLQALLVKSQQTVVRQANEIRKLQRTGV